MTATLRRTATVATTLTLALALAPSAALAAGPHRVTQGDGTLLADGAAVRVPATFSCPAGYMAYLTAQLIQAIGDEFAGGFDTTAKPCSGSKQKVTFFIQAVPAGDNTRPFRPGTASSRVILDAVDPESQEPYYEELPPGEGEGEGESSSVLPPLPPLSGAQHAVTDGPTPVGAPPTVHAEARGTIELKEKARR